KSRAEFTGFAGRNEQDRGQPGSRRGVALSSTFGTALPGPTAGMAAAASRSSRRTTYDQRRPPRAGAEFLRPATPLTLERARQPAALPQRARSRAARGQAPRPRSSPLARYRAGR